MSERTMPEIGSVGWIDLTVPDAERIRDFCTSVVGWRTSLVTMGKHRDFTMITPVSGTASAGVCQARGNNADLPAQWLIYITVGGLDTSVSRCNAGGGRVIVAPRGMGKHGRYWVIRDTAGAVAALFEPARPLETT
ncbi:MAG: VOC family protein [Acidobacteriota bacterium]